MASTDSRLPPLARSLSARLLVLTIFFVMLAEIFIFAPSIARFRLTAKMPKQFIKVARAALDVATEMTQTGGDNREMFKQIMLERVLTAFEVIEQDLDSENIDYLIGKLHKIDTPDDQAA